MPNKKQKKQTIYKRTAKSQLLTKPAYFSTVCMLHALSKPEYKAAYLGKVANFKGQSAATLFHQIKPFLDKGIIFPSHKEGKQQHYTINIQNIIELFYTYLCFQANNLLEQIEDWQKHKRIQQITATVTRLTKLNESATHRMFIRNELINTAFDALLTEYGNLYLLKYRHFKEVSFQQFFESLCKNPPLTNYEAFMEETDRIMLNEKRGHDDNKGESTEWRELFDCIDIMEICGFDVTRFAVGSSCNDWLLDKLNMPKK